ncbi:MAG: XrtV sorting system accessory protein [Sphingomonadaceae bacterium]
METVFDWMTMAVFAGLIVLFLQRSTEEEPRDSLWQYLVAAVGCAVCNYLGNEVHPVPAILVMGAVLAFIHFSLKPFESKKL